MKSLFTVIFITLFALNSAAQDVAPMPTHQEAPIYPPNMSAMRQTGVVTVAFVVDKQGQVQNPVVVSSTNPGFNQAAIDAVLKWSYAPGLHLGVPVDSQIELPITFQSDAPGGGSEAFQVSDRKVDQSKLPPEFRYDIPPKPINAVFAVYPFELLRDHIGGSAQVGFCVSPEGEVQKATVLKATRPEFGWALVAMLDESKFQPAMKAGKPTWSLLRSELTFSEASSDVPVSDEAIRLLHELKRERPAFCPPKDLDAKPRPLSRRSPVFPSALVGRVASGRAVVDFIIDHNGDVQLPRVVSATDPAFGYAAVQGVSSWKFAPLTRHGRGVAVRVQIPIDFISPNSAATAGKS
ncbi:MAG: TonB family protein [Opitutaceae bacterium]|jgi:TonB family protein